MLCCCRLVKICQLRQPRMASIRPIPSPFTLNIHRQRWLRHSYVPTYATNLRKPTMHHETTQDGYHRRLDQGQRQGTRKRSALQVLLLTTLFLNISDRCRSPVPETERTWQRAKSSRIPLRGSGCFSNGHHWPPKNGSSLQRTRPPQRSCTIMGTLSSYGNPRYSLNIGQPNAQAGSDT